MVETQHQDTFQEDVPILRIVFEFQVFQTGREECDHVRSPFWLRCKEKEHLQSKYVTCDKPCEKPSSKLNCCCKLIHKECFF